jgi:hypothetical protein
MSFQKKKTFFPVSGEKKNVFWSFPDAATLLFPIATTAAGVGLMSAVSAWGWLRLHLALACLLPSCPLLLLTYTTFSSTWEGGGLPPYRVLLRRYGGSGQAVIQNNSSGSMTLVIFRKNREHKWQKNKQK